MLNDRIKVSRAANEGGLGPDVEIAVQVCCPTRAAPRASRRTARLFPTAAATRAMALVPRRFLASRG